jgi:hypothetical protein
VRNNLDNPLSSKLEGVVNSCVVDKSSKSENQKRAATSQDKI